MPAHEVEDRLAVLNARRIIANPKAHKAHQQAQAEEHRAAKRAQLSAAMDALQQMRPDAHWRM